MNEEKEKVKNLTAMHEEEEKIEVRNKEPITLPYSTWLFQSILQLKFGFRVYTLQQN